MKKKITALCLCVAILAVAVVGASLAYFTDNDQADNTFTAGSVKIQLIEEQSNADRTGFVPYDGDKVLMPIVGSAQGEKYPNGQPRRTTLTKSSPSRTTANPPRGSAPTMPFLPLWMTAMIPSMPARISCTATSAITTPILPTKMSGSG